MSTVDISEDEDTLKTIEKYENYIDGLLQALPRLISIKSSLFIENKIFDNYVSNRQNETTTIYVGKDQNISLNKNNFEIMEEDIKYVLINDENIIKENIKDKFDYETKSFEFLYKNSKLLDNVIIKMSYVNVNDIKLKLYKLEYVYYYLMCAFLRYYKGNYYNFIKISKDEFKYMINKDLQGAMTPPSSSGGGNKSLSVNKIKEIADKLKVSHSKCKSKESIMTKIKSIDLEKLTIEQLKIYCKLFNIKGCSKCKSKKSLLLHTKSNMKIR
jgi:hypothetical protein